MINWHAREEDKQAAATIRLLLTANVTTYDTMYGVLGEYDSDRCKALRHAAQRLEYTAQYGHIERAKPAKNDYCECGRLRIACTAGYAKNRNTIHSDRVARGAN